MVDGSSDQDYVPAKVELGPARKRSRRGSATATTRSQPGFSAEDPISIDDDEDDVVETTSNLVLLSESNEIEWRIYRAIWGNEILGLDEGSSPVVMARFSRRSVEFMFPDKTRPDVSVDLGRLKPFLNVAFNLIERPFFIAFRPNCPVDGILRSAPSTTHDERYIVLFFDDADHDSSQHVKSLFEEICPKVLQISIDIDLGDLSLYDSLNQRPRRRTTRSATLKSALLNKQDALLKGISEPKQIFVEYPIESSSHRIALTKNDLEVLDPGNFLNDSIVDFYLLYLKLIMRMLMRMRIVMMGSIQLLMVIVTSTPSWTYDEDNDDMIIMMLKIFLSQEHISHNRFHMFNSFFYKRYTSAAVSPQDGQAESYNAVRKWTRNVNLFEKDFLIMPVCERLHWSCVIACFPGRVGVPLDSDQPTYPCLLLMDSLGSHSGPKLFRMLRNYLTSEWNARQNTEPALMGNLHRFTKDNMPGLVVQVPKQSNDCDCGLFMLQYIEEFMKEPFADFRKPQVQHPDWFSNELVDGKRTSLRNTLLSLADQWRKQQSSSGSDHSKLSDFVDDASAAAIIESVVAAPDHDHQSDINDVPRSDHVLPGDDDSGGDHPPRIFIRTDRTQTDHHRDKVLVPSDDDNDHLPTPFARADHLVRSDEHNLRNDRFIPRDQDLGDLLKFVVEEDILSDASTRAFHDHVDDDDVDPIYIRQDMSPQFAALQALQATYLSDSS